MEVFSVGRATVYRAHGPGPGNNWHDLIFYRPEANTRYQHIDALFGEEAVDWDLIETHWTVAGYP